MGTMSFIGQGGYGGILYRICLKRLDGSGHNEKERRGNMGYERH